MLFPLLHLTSPFHQVQHSQIRQICQETSVAEAAETRSNHHPFRRYRFPPSIPTFQRWESTPWEWYFFVLRSPEEVLRISPIRVPRRFSTKERHGSAPGAGFQGDELLRCGEGVLDGAGKHERRKNPVHRFQSEVSESFPENCGGEEKVLGGSCFRRIEPAKESDNRCCRHLQDSWSCVSRAYSQS